MTRFENFILQSKPKINKFLNKWGYKEHSSRWYKKKAEIIAWLENDQFNVLTANGEYRYAEAFALLDHIKYINDQDVNQVVEKISKRLEKKCRELDVNIEKLALYPLGDSGAEGGGRLIKEFIEWMSLQKYNAPAINFKDESAFLKSDMIVFIDDFVGSGKTVEDYYNEHKSKIDFYRQRKKKVVFLSLIGFKSKIEGLADKFDWVDVGISLTEKDKIFSEHSAFYQENPSIAKSVQEWCTEIGRELYEKAPLGYDNSQTLIVFTNNTPNNTLPIIWAGVLSETKSNAGNSWAPLFARKKALTKKKSNPIILIDTIIFNPSLINDENRYKAIERLLEVGDYITAVNFLKSAGGDNELSISDKLEIIKINQKAGFIRDHSTYGIGARTLINSVLENKKQFLKLSPKMKAQLLLLDLKTNCQEHNFERVIRYHSKTLNAISKELNKGLLHGALHRIAVAYAIREDYKMTQKYLDESLSNVNFTRNIHAEATGNMFRAIIQSLRGVELGLDNCLKTLYESSANYFGKNNDFALAQFNELKSAVQCLYAEGAILIHKNQPDKGMLRLFIGNLLVDSAKGHPESEGYSELLALIKEERIKRVVRLAMLSDLKSRIKFQTKIKNLSKYILLFGDITSNLIENRTLSNWEELRATLVEVDSKFFPVKLRY